MVIPSMIPSTPKQNHPPRKRNRDCLRPVYVVVIAVAVLLLLQLKGHADFLSGTLTAKTKTKPKRETSPAAILSYTEQKRKENVTSSVIIQTSSVRKDNDNDNNIVDTDEFEFLREHHNTNGNGNNTANINSDNTELITRAWPSSLSSFPCYKPGSFKDSQQGRKGMLFVKALKVGGSTVAGIQLQIAKHAAERHHHEETNQQPESQTLSSIRFCQNSCTHRAGMTFRRRFEGKSFLWTILREPEKREISYYFFFKVTRGTTNYSDTEFKDFLEKTNKKASHYYLKLHSTNQTALEQLEHSSKSKNEPLAFNEYKDIANEIMLKYDFMAITERFDESMVALSILLGEDVTLGDMLYLSSKTAGSYDGGAGGLGCSYIQKSFLTDEMKKYFKGDNGSDGNSDDNNGDDKDIKDTTIPTKNPYTWEERIRWDRALYEAANRSLDRTIDEVIGRKKFQRELATYRTALKLVDQNCAHVSKPPCTRDGKLREPHETNCLVRNKDWGCAYQCIEEVAKSLNISSI